MDVLRVLLFFLASFSSVYIAAGVHEGHVDVYENILNTMKLNHSMGMRLQNLTSLLKRLGLDDCTNKTNINHKCVTSTSLFAFFNISNTKSLEETEFSKIASIIVYSLLPSEEHHSEENHNNSEDHDDRFIGENVVVYDELLERYETLGLCEQILDRLLKDINESIGEQLDNKSKCFSIHDILHDLNMSSDGQITKINLPMFSTIIVSNLLQKHCIEIEYKTPLPCNSFFVNKLFKKYAKNNVVDKEKIEELLKKLKIGEHESIEETTNDDHNHRRRRRYISSSSLSSDEVSYLTSYAQKKEYGRFRREVKVHHDEHDKDHAEVTYEKCYSANELFAIYHVDEKIGFNIGKFGQLSSALVYQIDSDVCITKQTDKHSDNDVLDKHKWGYGIFAVAVISLCSVAGVSIIPFMATIFYQKAIVFLISLAVGTLAGDALLHLLPHSASIHDHSESGSSHEDEKRLFWKFLVAVAGIYAFFLFETLTHLFLRKSIGHSHSVEHTRKHSQFSEDGLHAHSHSPHEVGEDACSHPGGQPVVLTNMANVETNVEANGDGKPHSDGDIKEEKAVKKPVTSVAWMIIIGDTIHNIADGIAIGVAFSDSTFGGISTSIAVFCHELPHELGDFAVLLSAGMTVKKALLANFFSACSCFIGLIFGILIGEIEDVNKWIFALTAGFFLYIALTDMLPELMHSSNFNGISKLSMVFLQNAGILVGFLIMILLSYYEEDIRI